MSGWPIALSFAGGLAVAAGGWLVWDAEPPQRSSAELMDVLMWSREPVGGPFALIDHNGTPRTDKDFRGKLLMVYFGFSYCTDICPTDLQSIVSVIDKLGPDSEKVQPLFISIDPEKDTPEQLQGYVALFHPRLIGLTGTPREIRRVARDFKVYVGNNVAATGSLAAIDHSGFVYLIGPMGDYLGFFPPGTPPDRMIGTMRPHLAALASR